MPWLADLQDLKLDDGQPTMALGLPTTGPRGIVACARNGTASMARFPLVHMPFPRLQWERPLRRVLVVMMLGC